MKPKTKKNTNTLKICVIYNKCRYMQLENRITRGEKERYINEKRWRLHKKGNKEETIIGEKRKHCKWLFWVFPD